jgi:geranylgeranyl diphosphate synthase type I
MTFQKISNEYLLKINNSLEFFFNNQIRNLDSSETFIKECYSIMKEYTLNGGKRLRPLSLILSYLATGGKDERKIFLPAIAVELHHTYSLILDDIMDEDELRRNRPTVYKKIRDSFMKNFKDEDYQGSLFSKKSSRFAVSYAIMMGNLTNILSKKAILESDFSDTIKVKALRIVEEADEKIYHGQMLDILMEHKKEFSEKKYLEMIKLKTAVLFGMTFELGALFSGTDDNTRHMLTEFGINSAIAYQIEDDIIDVLGDKGHELGSDIRKGKKTLLIIKTLEEANDSQKKFVSEAYGNQSANEDAIKKVIRIMKETKAVDYSRRLANNYIQTAKKFILGLKLDAYYKEVFLGFIDSMINRTT